MLQHDLDYLFETARTFVFPGRDSLVPEVLVIALGGCGAAPFLRDPSWLWVQFRHGIFSVCSTRSSPWSSRVAEHVATLTIVSPQPYVNVTNQRILWAQ